MPVRQDEFLPYLDPLRKLRRNNRTLCYSIAVAGVGLAGLARWALEGILIGGTPFITFFPAVIAVAFVGGLGPGLVSVIVSVMVADYFFIPPASTFWLSWGDGVALTLFAVTATFNVLLVALLNEAIDRIARQEQNARLILETAPAGMIAVDEDGAITLVNAAAEKLFGYQRDELIGQHIEVLVPERLCAGHVVLRDAYLRQPTTRPMGAGRDLFGRQKSGMELPLEVGLNPVARENKTGALATIVDISERKAAERKQQILVREVQHRAKNLLTIIQAVAARTFTPDRPVAESRRNFEAKLLALARTHELFFTQGKVSLVSIVKGELVAFPDQATIEGADVLLTATAAQNFTLIVHELATNAVKYGALSVPSGKIDVQWRSEEGQLVFDWREQGGPDVSPPTRQGFGHVILTDLAKGFSAKVASEYATAGFHYGLSVSLATITELASRDPDTSAAA
jgi:PAS domain S-box-containing protein